MVADIGSPSSWGLVKTNTGTKDADGNPIYDYASQKWIAQELSNRMKVTTKCWKNDCSSINIPTYYLNGIAKDSDFISTTQDYTFILNNGIIVTLGWTGLDGSFDIAVIFYKLGKPAYIGKDLFYFKFDGTKLIPEGADSTFDTTCINSSATKCGRSCTAWVIYNENMDYLRCPGALSWNGPTTCP